MDKSSFRFPAPENAPVTSPKAYLSNPSPDTDYFTLAPTPKHPQAPKVATCPKPHSATPLPGSISSLGSEATLSSGTSDTDHFRTSSGETLVEESSPKTKGRRPTAISASSGGSQKPEPFLSGGISDTKGGSESGCGGSFFGHLRQISGTVSRHIFSPSEIGEKLPTTANCDGGLRPGEPRPEPPTFEAGPIPERPGMVPLEPNSSSRLKTEPLPALPGSTPFPKLRLQHTLPSLSMQDVHREPGSGSRPKSSPRTPKKESFREEIIKLSGTISYISPDRAAVLLQQSRAVPETGLKDVLALDIRPFADFAKSHVTGAINICLPSTLLKRATFNFSRCLVSLPTYEKTILQQYLSYNERNFVAKTKVSGLGGAYGLPSIIVYDTVNTSANILHICKKLVDHTLFHEDAAPPIYVVDCPLDSFSTLYAGLFSSGNSDLVDISALCMQAPEAADAPVEAVSRAAPVEIAAFGKESVRTPIISNFSLPRNLPEKQFKIRHNEQRFDFSAVSEEELGVPLTSTEAQLLPQWLRDSVANTNHIRQNFQRLEECEKRRLNSAFKLGSHKAFHTPGGSMDATPVINSGLDLGYKNRYRDIFLYEHSRVLLSDCNGCKTGVSQQDCDYINASYLRPYMQHEAVSSFLSSSRHSTQLNYLATQGPMQKTAGDFWRCVYNQKCVVVVSLTGETDNGVEKCYAFWNPGEYYSEQKRYRVTMVHSDHYKNVVVRKFAVENDNVVHHVTQMHLSTWQDMTSDVDLDEILFMVHLKRRLLHCVQDLPEYPSAVHCSAGCGRTGVFVVADTLINTLTSDLRELSADPVYDIVNDLRKQRISMVQTLRQYSLIYSILRESIVRRDDFSASAERVMSQSCR